MHIFGRPAFFILCLIYFLSGCPAIARVSVCARRPYLWTAGIRSSPELEAALKVDDISSCPAIARASVLAWVMVDDISSCPVIARASVCGRACVHMYGVD